MYAFYVYYRVPPELAVLLQPRISALQAALVKDTEISARQLIKADEPLLWMEIYEGIVDRENFERRLGQQAAAFGVTQLLAEGIRKTEIFRER